MRHQIALGIGLPTRQCRPAGAPTSALPAHSTIQLQGDFSSFSGLLAQPRAEANFQMGSTQCVSFWIVAVMLGTCAGFGAGYLTGTQLAQSQQQDAVRQELLKQLVATKAAIEIGLALGDLRASEKNVQTALELAANRLNDEQRQVAGKALHAISQTVAAWEETFSKCHAGRDGYVWLGDFAPKRVGKPEVQ
jgi:hypothetical protein